MAIIITYSRTQSCCIAYISIMENYTSFKMLVLKKSYIYECASAMYQQGCVLHKCQEIQAEALKVFFCGLSVKKKITYSNKRRTVPVRKEKKQWSYK